MSPTHTSTKRTSLLTLGSAAVIAVYAAGYVRTRSAGEAFAAESDRRPAHVSSPVAIHRTAAEVTDSMAVASITAAVNAPRTRASAKRSSAAKPAPKRIATAIKKSPPVQKIAPAVPVQAPAAPEPAPVVVQPVPEPAKPAEPARGQYTDGTYRGYGTSRHGDIEAEVEIRNGRIASARISQCLTRYSCSWISELPGQVVARQSADVDYVSGATQSSDAFYQAVLEALNKAK